MGTPPSCSVIPTNAKPIKGENMAIKDDSFDVILIDTKNGLRTTKQITLAETAEEMQLRSIQQLEISEGHQKLIEQLSDKVISQQDRIDALEQAMDKVFTHLNDDSLDKLILDRLSK
jgi:uncharacterized coiled-coil protein SlyX